jgi:hypothetical protein
MNLGSIVDSFATSYKLTVTRRAARTVVNGVYVPGDEETFTLRPAVVYPASGRQLALLPEGQRTSEAVTIFTKCQLRGAKDPAGYAPDRVTYRGTIYEIQLAGDWAAPGGYYHSLGVKVPLS